MKQASVADLRNKFARISKWIEAGEAVEITKRGRLFATLKPAKPKRGTVEWPRFRSSATIDLAARRAIRNPYFRQAVDASRRLLYEA